MEEKKDWKERLGSYDSWASNESMFITIDGETIYTIDELKSFIQQELDKAREEGYQKGWEDGSKGKVFEKIEVETEVTFKDLRDVIVGKEDAWEFLSKLITK